MRFKQFRPRDIVWFARTGWLLVLIELRQRRVSLPRLVRSIDVEVPVRSAGDGEVKRIVWLVRVVLRRTYGDRFCMKQSLVLFHFLRSWGLPTRINFGVLKRNGRLTGHAWLELDGSPIAEAQNPRLIYNIVFQYPPVTDSEEKDEPGRERDPGAGGNSFGRRAEEGFCRAEAGTA